MCHKEPVRLSLLGHSGEPTGMWDENLITEKRLVLCPVKQLLDADPTVRAEVYELAYVQFPLFKAGHLFVRGAISDQPAWWLEAMMFLETLDLRKKAAYSKAIEGSGDAS